MTHVDVSSFSLKPNLASLKAEVGKLDLDKSTPVPNDLAKIIEIKGKISSATGLAANSVLTNVETKIPNVSNLVKKTVYNTKISEIEMKITDHNHDKYITTEEFNNLAEGDFTTRLAQADLAAKINFDTKKNSNKRKRQINTFDATYFRGKNYFYGDGTQNYLVFQPVYRCFEIMVGNRISS